jgi:hypothetical protein
LIPGDVACDGDTGIAIELCGDAIESDAVYPRVRIVGDGQVYRGSWGWKRVRWATHMVAVGNEPEKVYCAAFPLPVHRLETETDEQVEVMFVQVPVNTMPGSVALTVTLETVGTDEGRVALDDERRDGVVDVEMGLGVKVEVDIDVDVDVYVYVYVVAGGGGPPEAQRGLP